MWTLAQAVVDPNTNPITWQALGTAAGASVMAGVIVQFVKIFKKNMGDDATRQVAAVFGVILVLAAVAMVNDDPGLAEYGLGLLVGIQAGLAASKSVDIAKAGLNHLVQRRS